MKWISFFICTSWCLWTEFISAHFQSVVSSARSCGSHFMKAERFKKLNATLHTSEEAMQPNKSTLKRNLKCKLIRFTAIICAELFACCTSMKRDAGTTRKGWTRSSCRAKLKWPVVLNFNLIKLSQSPAYMRSLKSFSAQDFVGMNLLIYAASIFDKKLSQCSP